MSDSLQPHGLLHARPPCLSPTPGVYSNSCPLSLMPSNHLIFCLSPLILISQLKWSLIFKKSSMYLKWLSRLTFVLMFTGVCLFAAASAKSLQSSLILCDPIDSSPWGSPVPGILQARALEWVAISFSNAWKRKVKVKLLSRVWLLETPWTSAHQAPLSMGFSRQEYWSGVPLPWLAITKYKLQIELPHDLAIPLLGIYPEKTLILKDTRTPCSLQHYLQ